ncbi:MAG TPA: SPFH domain-containing protein [Anaerolineae bacterium]|nr:SPFH domain-containing protein [Anaerolineae bacterium]
MGILESILGVVGGGTLLIAVAVLFLVVVFLMAMARVLRFIRKVPPNRALLVYGVRTRTKVTVIRRIRRLKASTEPVVQPPSERPEVNIQEWEVETRTEEIVVNYKIVKGGMTIVLPFVHEVKELDLSLITLDVAVHNVLSSNAVPIMVDGIAQIKIGSDDTSIATAAEQLLDKSTEDIKYVAIQTLQGHLRAIIGLMTVEEVYKDREAFAQMVLQVAVDDLAGMGLQIVSFTIKEISDDKGYLEALGRPEIAAKLRDARRAEAQAEQEATEKEQAAEKAKAGFTKEANVAKAKYDAEVAREQAVAERSQAISLAEQDKTLEERKGTAAQAAAERRDRELDAEERRPADASLYRAEQEASATRATGFAQADVDRRMGEAEAAANKARGLAGADVTKAQLLAEAEGRRELAEALNAYKAGALRLVLGQSLLEKVPDVALAFGEAFANIEQIRLIDIGGAGARGEGVEGSVERFLDTLPNTLFKFLQGTAALLGGPIDDLVAAWIVEEAEKRGVEVAPEQQEAIREMVATRVAEVEAEEESQPANEDEVTVEEEAEEGPAARSEE